MTDATVVPYQISKISRSLILEVSGPSLNVEVHNHILSSISRNYGMRRCAAVREVKESQGLRGKRNQFKGWRTRTLFLDNTRSYQLHLPVTTVTTSLSRLVQRVQVVLGASAPLFLEIFKFSFKSASYYYPRRLKEIHLCTLV
jgi:hypothetical protein